MRIVYLFHEYHNRRKRYGIELAKQGHDVVFVKVKKKHRDFYTEKNVMYDKPDVLFLLNP